MLTINRRIAIRIILAILLVFGLIYAVLEVTKIRSPEYNLANTGINFSSNYSIRDGKLIGYDSVGFYELDSSFNTKNYLFTFSYKLPSIKDFTLLKDGALVTLNGSILGTPVMNYAMQNNINIYSLEDTLWYIDFNKNTFTKLGNAIVQDETLFYSSKDTGAYYVTRVGKNLQLNFFEEETKSSITRIEQLPFNSIKTISLCETSATCIVGNSSSDNKYTVKQIVDSDKLRNIVSTKTGYVEPIGENNYAIFIPETREEHNHSNEDTGETHIEDEVLNSYSSIAVYNSSTKDSSTIQGNFVEGSITLRSVNGTIYLLDQANNTYIRYGKNLLGLKREETKPLLLSGKDYEAGFTQFIGFIANNKSFLLGSLDGSMYIFKESNTSIESKKLDVNQIQNRVTECVDALSDNITYNQQTKYIEVMVVDDKDFNAKIKTINECLATKSNYIGLFNLKYVGYSPVNGRVTTD